MNRHELAHRNRALAHKRHEKRRPGGLFPYLTRTPREVTKGEIKRILALCPGDASHVLFSTPALYALRAAYPQASITAGVGLLSEPMLRHNREVDDLHIIPVLDAPLDDADQREMGGWPSKLEGENYDATIVMAPAHWLAALLAARARIPRRVGLDLGGSAAGYLTDAVSYDPESHVVMQNLRLVETLAGARPQTNTTLRFWMNDTVVSLALRSGLAQLANKNDLLVVILPGDGTRPGDWRAESWAFLADHLILEAGANVALAGGERGTIQRRAIERAMRFEPALVEESLDPLFAAALLARCSLAIGGHSGLAHLAVALNRPALVLYGPDAPVEVGPWGDATRWRALKSDMRCAPCCLPDWPSDSLVNHPCVRDIDSYRVLDAALELLETTSAAASRPSQAKMRSPAEYST